MERWADSGPGFFDIYSDTLGRSHFCILRCLQWYTSPIWSRGFFGTYRNILYQSGISGQDAQSASVTCSVFFLSAGSVSQRKVASGRAAAEEGCLLLGLRETALLRQGLLSEPKASSGPAAMLLAVSRSPSSIPRRSPCPDRYHLPLASLVHIHPRTDSTFLWRPPLHPKKKRHPADSTLPDTGNKTPVKQTYTIYNQHSPSAQLNYHQKVLSATQDRWPAL